MYSRDWFLGAIMNMISSEESTRNLHKYYMYFRYYRLKIENRLTLWQLKLYRLSYNKIKYYFCFYRF